MKRTTIHLVTGIFLLAATIAGCSKYEEGPAISLRSKKARVANNWKIDEQTQNGQKEDPSNYEGIEIELTKDGDATWSFSSQGISGSFSGTWEFNDDKTKLIMMFNDQGLSDTTESEILKLKEKEMWLKDEDDNGNTTETHLVPA